jgi:hypothetical protein
MRDEPRELGLNRRRHAGERGAGIDPCAGRAVIAVAFVVAVVAGVLVLLYVRHVRSVSPPAPAAGETGSPVFGKARFGMTVEEMKALYPQMEDLNKSLGAAVAEGRFITRRVLWQQQLPGLPDPTDIELRFWKNQLWVVIVYFGNNDLDTIMKMLTERYGPPQGDPGSPVWSGPTSTVIVAAKARWYSAYDNVISKDAQAVFMEDLKRSLERRAAARRGRTSEGGEHLAATAGPPSVTPAATVTAGQ